MSKNLAFSITIFLSSLKGILIAQNKNKSPINENIRAQEVMLIDSDGVKKGVVPLQDALEEAKNVSLDLVQVSSTGSSLLFVN